LEICFFFLGGTLELEARTKIYNKIHQFINNSIYCMKASNNREAKRTALCTYQVTELQTLCNGALDLALCVCVCARACACA